MAVDASSVLHPSPPQPGIADIFRAHGEAYRRSHLLTPAQLKAMAAIERCRTAALGGHLYRCVDCGYSVPVYNSCRNRHCPTCQALVQGRWIEGRAATILPTAYFHVVFTLPQELRPIALGNQRLVYDMLFRAASQTLIELAHDPEWIGGDIGITAILHTWTRELHYHPHLHCIATGGALSFDRQRWIEPQYPNRFLFPVRVMSRLFRGKLIALFKAAFRAGEFVLVGAVEHLRDPQAFATLCDALFRHEWVVYAKQPFAGARHLYDYLGRYTHRVGISNQRVLAIDQQAVTFRTRNDTLTLTPEQFIGRFLLHILPDRFVKIRHYGLFAASNLGTKLACARQILGDPPRPQKVNPTLQAWRELLDCLAAGRPMPCPVCHTGRITRQPLKPVPRDPLTYDARAP